MTMVSVGATMRWPGVVTATSTTPSVTTDQTLDAAGEYVAYVFQAREDMVVSHVGWRTGVVAGSPTADTRIETVDASGVPTGTLWATNTNLVSGTLTSNTFTLHALTASATISKGSFFAVKIVYNSGTSIIVSRITGARPTVVNAPYAVTNTSGSAAKSVIGGFVCMVLGSGATTFYCVDLAIPAAAISAGAFNNTSSAKRGLRFQVPFKCRVAGIGWYNTTSVGDLNVALLDDSGSELASSSTAIDGDYTAASGNAGVQYLFDNAVILTPGTWYRASLEPTSATNITLYTATLPSANYRTAWPHGANANYATYTSGGGWVDTATDTLPILDLIIDQVDDGAGSTGMLYIPNMEGT